MIINVTTTHNMSTTNNFETFLLDSLKETGLHEKLKVLWDKGYTEDILEAFKELSLVIPEPTIEIDGEEDKFKRAHPERPLASVSKGQVGENLVSDLLIKCGYAPVTFKDKKLVDGEFRKISGGPVSISDIEIRLNGKLFFIEVKNLSSTSVPTSKDYSNFFKYLKDNRYKGGIIISLRSDHSMCRYGLTDNRKPYISVGGISVTILTLVLQAIDQVSSLLEVREGNDGEDGEEGNEGERDERMELSNNVNELLSNLIEGLNNAISLRVDFNRQQRLLSKVYESQCKEAISMMKLLNKLNISVDPTLDMRGPIEEGKSHPKDKLKHSLQRYRGNKFLEAFGSEARSYTAFVNSIK